MPLRVLIFGSTGLLARELRAAKWESRTERTFLDRAEADLGAPGLLGDQVRRHRPHAVVIAAAYTAVDKAEHDEAAAFAVNAHGPAAIAQACAALEIPILGVSTDYVFDGTKGGWYGEADAARPLNVYGRSKLAGEEAVRQANRRHLILRTSWVFGPHGSNFFNTMLRLSRSQEVRVVTDQLSCPTPAGDLAASIAELVPKMLDPAAPFGLYHFAGGADATRHDFAVAIFAGLARRGLPAPRIVPVATSDFPAEAQRPLNSRLSSQRIESAFGVRTRGWKDALPDVLDQALAARAGSGAASGAA